ncbi:MAG: biopolymer transporter ExbD [Myxococcales bacterium]|nr:biopolymer transporter ExbD [Myxococcales bacterium]
MFDESMGRRNREQQELPILNLNSMMDMLSIILVFLLCNSSAEEQDFVLAKNLSLPGSTSKLGFTKAVQVKITRSELLVEDTFVAKISGHRLVGAEVDGSKIVPLFNMLKRYKALAKSQKNKNTVVLQADKGFSFEVLNSVLRTCAMAGYPQFRFAIQKE